MNHSMTIEALGSNCYSSLAIPACDISNDRYDDREALVFFEHDEVAAGGRFEGDKHDRALPLAI